ncbi:MAG: hypothetical protein D6806_04915 [Deltaproteobacteria bacterium]|nr:MAG: hypothetical protein D6806_04915 [Deltaproteobacteria bacterium]
MSPSLQPVDPEPRCSICGAPAAGNCAICHRLLCPDCAELKQGMSRPLAVCSECAGRRLRAGRGLLAWVAVVAFFLLVSVALGLWLLD